MVRSLRSPGHLALMRALIEARKAQGVSQQRLADRLDRPQSFVAKVETGERRLDVVEFAEWALALGVDTAPVMAVVRDAVRATVQDVVPEETAPSAQNPSLGGDP